MSTETPKAAADLFLERSPELSATLDAALRARGANYCPNTHLLLPDGGPRYTNRLILEASPYLLQHAHNPVDWRAWSPETFERAQKEDKPVFLSIGYATCHWCHVMEEESFDDEEVAAALNSGFISIKLDREARPDLDHIYMLATQLMTGHGGWPNSVFLLADGRPFFAGSYFPKAQFLRLLASVLTEWKSPRRQQIEAQAARLSSTITGISARLQNASPLSADTYRNAVAQIRRSHNEFDGGFSRTMQFPQETYLLFLLDQWRRTGEPAALAVATRTLRAIAAGGIHDHVGGGFHRYTVDTNWRTPHFEKMLYNQALLSRAFVEGYAATGEPAFRRAAERAFDYVRRDMTVLDGPAAGAFYSAEDADSLAPSGDREEGYFYAWTPDSAGMAAGAEAGARVVETLGLHASPTLECGAVAHLNPDAKVDFAILDPVLDRLLEARDQRPRPRRDEKVLADWNGMMIRAFAEGGLRLGEPRHTATAQEAAEAIWRALHTEEGGLSHFYAEGRAEGNGFLSDYACLGLAFLALHDGTRNGQWLQRAESLATQILLRFEDGSGRYREASENGPLGPIYVADDGATPSGESATLEFLGRLAIRSENPKYRDRAEALVGAISGTLSEHPLQKTTALVATALLESGESESSRSIAHGHGRVIASLQEATLRLSVTLDEGWHVNADVPNHPDLIATELTIPEGPEGARVLYPDRVERELGFTVGPLALFEGTFEIKAEWPSPAAVPLSVSLTIQACSDRVCFPPETHVFRLR